LLQRETLMPEMAILPGRRARTAIAQRYGAGKKFTPAVSDTAEKIKNPAAGQGFVSSR